MLVPMLQLSTNLIYLNGHSISWNSSSELPGRGFLVNERMYLAFIASGIIPVQYKKFSQFGCIGNVSDASIGEQLIRFAAIVAVLCRISVNSALFEEQIESEQSDIVTS